MTTDGDSAWPEGNLATTTSSGNWLTPPPLACPPSPWRVAITVRRIPRLARTQQSSRVSTSIERSAGAWDTTCPKKRPKPSLTPSSTSTVFDETATRNTDCALVSSLTTKDLRGTGSHHHRGEERQ